jgi:hypothetical protein
VNILKNEVHEHVDNPYPRPAFHAEFDRLEKNKVGIHAHLYGLTESEVCVMIDYLVEFIHRPEYLVALSDKLQERFLDKIDGNQVQPGSASN